MRRVGLVVALVGLGCAGLPGTNPCAARSVCAEEGQCGTSFEVGGEGGWRCHPRDAADCAASEVCDRHGRCAYDDRVALECVRPEEIPAVPPDPEACALSSDCVRWGRCSALEGACLAVDEADCRQSLDCIVSGKCSKVGNHCFAASDADCAGSLECAAFGRCARFRHPLLGAGGACSGPDGSVGPSCNYTGAGADHCARTGECLHAGDGVCETVEAVGLVSPALEDARRRLREARGVRKPSRLR